MTTSDSISRAQPRVSGAYSVSTPPVQLTSFVGREREIEAVLDHLESSRLLTLTGAGGTGKTRLAFEVAARGGVRYAEVGWVDLAPLADPALVPPAVAGAFGYREEAGRAALDLLIESVGDRPLLLVLDNCEHVVDACASLVEVLLRKCRELVILATSREALGVSGEQAWLVPPLALPDPKASSRAAEVRDAEAVRLFVDRARATAPAFQLTDHNAAAVAQICRRLDGIPLAIELAAARLRVLAPEQIAARLDDAFRLLSGAGRSTVPRHRTLREAIDWSHALLTGSEAALFRRLSVFAGSFSLDAVEAICPGDPVAAAEVLDLVATLVDKSLVIMETWGNEARYRLLETLRQYARERLREAGEEADLQERHAGFFVELAAAAERPIFGGNVDAVAIQRLTAEEGNLRAAADWAEASATGADHALRLVSALHWHWFALGHFREGKRRTTAALVRLDQASPLAQGKALVAASTIAFWLGEHDAVAESAARGVEILRRVGEPWILAYGLTCWGIGLAIQDPVAAQAPLDEAAALARREDLSVQLVFTLYWQARIAMVRGELDFARTGLLACLSLSRQMGARVGIAHSLTMLGTLDTAAGELAPARANLSEALRLHQAIGDLLGMIWGLEGLARHAAASGEADRAARLMGSVSHERERIGAAWSSQDRAATEEFLAGLRTRLGPESETAFLEGRRLSLDDATALALTPLATESRATSAALTPAPTPSAPPIATPREGTAALEVFALGPLKILRDGRPVERDAWGSAKPRELLLFLLSHPEGCTREQVGVAFWPEASTEQVRNNFHVTLHRLRKTLGGPHWVLLEDDRYLLDAGLGIDYDASRFEHELPAALARLKSANDPAPLEAALALYQGDLLEHESMRDWHLDIRDRHRRLYVDGMMALGHWWLRQEAWREAAAAFRQVIARDQLHEPAYRHLMTALAKSGDRSEALRLYQRLAKLLEVELEAEPEPETAALYRQLQG